MQLKPLVKLAFIGPITGAPAAKGRGGRNAAELAVRQRNEDGAARFRYELVIGDDACRPAVGVEVAEAVARDSSIIAGITHYCSQVALACVHIYHRYAFPVVVWGAHVAEVTDGNDFPEIHRVSGTFAIEDDYAARFMRAQGFATWAILHDPTHYGEGHAESFARCLSQEGGSIRRIFPLSVDQQELTSEVNEIRGLGVDVVYVATAPGAWWATNAGSTSLQRPPTDTPGWLPTPARLARQLSEGGVEAKLQGPAAMMRDRRVIDDMGEAGDGAFSFEEGAPLDVLPGGPDFAAAYASAGFAEPPEAFGPFAYAATTLVMDVVESVGPDRLRVRDELNRIRNHATLIGPVTFNAKGQNVTLPVSAYVAERGQWILWERSERHSIRTRSLT